MHDRQVIVAVEGRVIKKTVSGRASAEKMSVFAARIDATFFRRTAGGRAEFINHFSDATLNVHPLSFAATPNGFFDSTTLVVMSISVQTLSQGLDCFLVSLAIRKPLQGRAQERGCKIQQH